MLYALAGQFDRLHYYFHSILLEDIAKKLNDLQMKIPSVEQQRRKQDDLIGNLNKQEDLLKNIDLKLNHFTPNINERKNRSDPQGNTHHTSLLSFRVHSVDMIKEISEPLHQAVDNLSKQQQPFLETLRELRQSQLSSNELSSKLDPLNQSIKAIQTGLSSCQSSFEYSSHFLQIFIIKPNKF